MYRKWVQARLAVGDYPWARRTGKTCPDSSAWQSHLPVLDQGAQSLALQVEWTPCPPGGAVNHAGRPTGTAGCEAGYRCGSKCWLWTTPRGCVTSSIRPARAGSLMGTGRGPRAQLCTCHCEGKPHWAPATQANASLASHQQSAPPPATMPSPWGLGHRASGHGRDCNTQGP